MGKKPIFHNFTVLNDVRINLAIQKDLELITDRLLKGIPLSIWHKYFLWPRFLQIRLIKNTLRKLCFIYPQL